MSLSQPSRTIIVEPVKTVAKATTTPPPRQEVTPQPAPAKA
jgi:hypothetical protein